MDIKRKTIAIDMDGVIADTVAQFIIWYEREFGESIEKTAFDGVPAAIPLVNIFKLF